jgi:hypothetical protein
MIRISTFIFSMFLSLQAFSEQPQLDCNNMPEGSVAGIPSIASGFAEVKCMGGLHFITFKKGWQWLTPDGKNFVEFYARPGFNTVADEVMFYTKIKAREVKGGEVIAKWSVPKKGLKGQNKPDKLVEIQAITNRGNKITINFFDNNWANYCNPICHPLYTFRLINDDRSSIEW